MGDIAVGGNFVCCLIIVVIFMALGGTYHLGADFKVIIWRESYKGIALFFYGGFDLSIQHVNVLILQLRRDEMHEMIKKWAWKFHAIIPALYPLWC